ncbi:MAG: hypothetical protein QOH97_3386 [Actinoplanes sp.]|nr:hypothetical protein [Actinoplanes sp.]
MALEVDDPQRDADTLWRTYVEWLSEHVPPAAALLNPPASDAAIADLERLIGHELPESVKAGWRLHDGQTCENDLGAAFGFWWLPVAEVAEQWSNWEDMRRTQTEEFFENLDVAQRSYPPKAIQRQYTSPGWIPLLRWPFDGDYVGLDFDPGPAGKPGQVINFGRDQEEKFVIADEFATLVAWLVQEAREDRVSTGTADDENENENEDERDLFEHADGILVNALRDASGAEFD